MPVTDTRKKPDPFAHLPETTEFMILLPQALVDDDARRERILTQMEAAFPGLGFVPMQCERLVSPRGAPMEIDEAAVVPLMGSVGEGSDPGGYRKRPSIERIKELNAAMSAFIAGASALN